MPARLGACEQLERRTLLSSFVVTNTNDSGSGSLRQAILDSNNAAGMNTIGFLLGSGPQTISVQSALPKITRTVTIDGSPQPGSGTGPITIDGHAAGAGANGFDIVVPLCTIEHLTIEGFAGVGVLDEGGGATRITDNVISGNQGGGILLTSGGEDTIARNFIGTDATGKSALGNGQFGIELSNAGNDNIIGASGEAGIDATDRNVISGNVGPGIILSGTTVTATFISGNLIGTDVTGTKALPNQGIGVVLDANSSGTDLSENLISSNAGGGIDLNHNTDSNRITSNFIGTDLAGKVSLGNGPFDVQLHGGATSNTIGGDGQRNVISGSNLAGIVLTDPFTTFNTILGNYVGTDSTGSTVLSHPTTRISIRNQAAGNIISGNVIPGAATFAILISDFGTAANRISGNDIGTDATGKIGLAPSGTADIAIESGAQKNIIGTDGDNNGDAGEGNVISGSAVFGVLITGIDATTHIATGQNRVAGNYIGTDVTGKVDLPNGGAGIAINGGASQNQIGTDGDSKSDDLERNVIAGNGGDGITISGSGTNSNTISGNYIGTDATGMVAMPNAGVGIRLSNAAGSNIIGVNDTGTKIDYAQEGNVIVGNVGGGISLSNSSGNTIAGNLLGTDKTGNTALLAQSAVEVQLSAGSANNVIGTNGNNKGDAFERNVISGTDSYGIVLTDAGTTGNWIAGNYVGTDSTGSNIIGYAAWRIAVQNGASNNVIGTNAAKPGIDYAAEGNVVAGASFDGILITDTGTTSNSVAGNFLGTDKTGKVALPNGFSGVAVEDGAAGTRIGTDGDGKADGFERNVISGNSEDGVDLGFAGANSVVAGNYIGLAADGETALGNQITGVYVVQSGPGTRIGTDGNGNGFDGNEGNVISANADYGISVQNSSGVVIAGNYIGTDALGSAARGNVLAGVTVGSSSTNIRIGVSGADRAAPLEQNVISGNGGSGVQFLDAGTTSNMVAGNYIGLARDGKTVLANQGVGVGAFGGSSGTLIGTNNNPVEANVIAGNATGGIQFNNSSGNTIAGNLVGTDFTGKVALGNGTTSAIVITGSSSNNRIGASGVSTSSDPLERNVIAGSAGAAILVFGAGAQQNWIAGNYLGTDKTGKASLGNGSYGIYVGSGASNNVIGVDTSAAGTDYAGERNIIAASFYDGILLTDAGTQNNVIAGDWIGTDSTGAVAMPNGLSGIEVRNGASNNRIGTNGDGTADAAEANVISGNSAYGIMLGGSGTASNRVAGNFVGTTAAGTGQLPNALGGIDIEGGAGNDIIGFAAGTANPAAERNTIAFNGLGGVVVRNGSTGNSIRQNAIFGNGGLGIDLGANGVSANDPGDTDSGPNDLQNFPVIAVGISGAQTYINGSLNSIPSSTFSIDVYANSNPGPAQRLLGTFTLTTDASGNATIDRGLSAATAAGETIVATATASNGSTSEFSVPIVVVAGPLADSTAGDPVNATEGTSTGSVVLATFIDTNASALATDFHTFVNWGGSTVATQPGNVQLVSRTANVSIWQVVGSAVYADAGQYAVTVTVTDGSGNSMTTSKTHINVADQPLTDATPVQVLSAVQGLSTGNLVLAKFVDADPYAVQSDFTAGVNWSGPLIGTPQSSVQLVSRGPTNSVWEVVGSATLATPGQRTIGVSVTDVSGGSTVSTHNTAIRVAVTWVGGSTGNWSTGSNWSTGHAPGATDDVVISNPGITITHSAGNDEVHSLTTAGTLVMSNGLLQVDANSSVGNFALIGGVLSGAGTITVTGSATWNAGEMAGPGTTDFQGGATLGFQSNSLFLDTRTLINEGTVAFSGTNGSSYASLVVSNGAVIRNLAGAVWDFQNDNSILQAAGGTPIGTFFNAGTLRKSGGTGTSSIGVLFKSTGTVDNQSGAGLNFSGGDDPLVNTWSVGSGSTLEFSGGTFTFGSNSSITGDGTVQVDGAAVNVLGAFDVGLTTISGGAMNFTGASAPTTGTLVQSGGTLSGVDSLVVAGATTRTGGAILLGQFTGSVTVDSSLNVPGEHDTYTFTLNSSSLLYFDSMTSDGSFQWSLSGPTGVVASNDFAHSDGANISNPLLNLVPGGYTLTVSGNGATTGSYGFRLADLASATPFTPGTPVSGTLVGGDSTNFHRFTATAGDQYTFSSVATGGNVGNDDWRLIDPFGDVIATAPLTSDLGTRTLNASGQYTLLIEGYVGNAGDATYAVNAQFLGNTPPVVSGTPLAVGSTVNGNLAVPGEQNTYTFTLGSSALLYFDALTNNGNFQWSLSGPAGSVVSSRGFTNSDGAGNSNPLLNLVPGGYTLTLFGNGATTGNYSFRLSDLASATPFTPGTPVSGTLVGGDSTNFHRFTATAGETIYLAKQVTSGNTSLNDLRLVDPYGDIILTQGLDGDGGRLTLGSAGTYTLLAEGYVGFTTDTSYLLNVIPVVDPPPQPLTVGSTVNGNLAVPGEQNTYTFTLGSSALLYFDALTNNGNFQWSLSGPAGSVVSSRGFTNSDGAGNSNPLLNLVPGGYTLTLFGNGATTGNYSFRLSDLASATPFTPGTPVSGTLVGGDSTNFHRFTATAGDQYTFSSLAAGGNVSNDDWRLIDPFGDVIATAPLTSDLGTWTLNASGQYTLMIEGYIGNASNATYMVNAHFLGNTPPVVSGTPLAVGSTVNGNLAVPGEHDTYTFTLNSSALLYFDSLTSDGSFQWSLSGPTGVVASNDFAHSDGANISNPLLNLVPGGYTLTVSGNGATTGSYGFRLADLASATPFNPGTPVSGTLVGGDSTNFHRFTATAGETFYVAAQVTSGNGSNDTLRLIDPYGNRIFSQNLSNDFGRVTLVNSGTYTLLAEGYVGNSVSADYALNVIPIHDPTPVHLAFASSLTDLTSPTTFDATMGVNSGDVVLATFESADPSASESDFTEVVHWGANLAEDASVGVQLVSRSGGTSIWQVVGSATYAESGLHSVSVIVFDADGSSLSTTATKINVADVTAPTSSVSPLPDIEDTTSFTVTWSGSDEPGGSGIVSYDAYVSDDGGAYVPFVSHSADTSARFDGQPGHTYSFYSIATDSAGNVEAAPILPDATTTVAPQLQVQSITAITPDPRRTPDDSIDVTFSKPVDLSTFDSSDLTLQLDGGPNRLQGATGITVGLLSGATYRISGLSGVTGADGNYVLTVDAAGIEDDGGNAGAGSASISWTMDATPPTVTSVQSVSSLRNDSVSTIDFTFSEPIDFGTLDVSDLTLTRDGGPNLLTGAQTLTLVSENTYRVTNLAADTATDGAYVLTVNAEGIQDLAGNTGVGSVSTAWMMDATPPTVASIQSVSSPRNTSVSTIDFTFSEPIDAGTLDVSDLTLTRDGGPDLLTPAQTVTFVSGNTYRIGNLPTVTGADGDYVLTIDATLVQDLAGNAGTESASSAWTMDATPPTVSSIQSPSSPRSTAVTTIDVIFSEPIAGTLDRGDLSLTRNGGSNLLTPAQTVTFVSGSTYRIGNLAPVTGADGDYVLTIDATLVQDLAGNTGTESASSAWTMDATPPTVSLLQSLSSPRNTAVSTIDFTFSEPIDAGTLDASDLSLTRDGGPNLLTDAQTVDFVSGNTYRLGNLAGVSRADGAYVLTVNSAGIQDVAGNAGIASASNAWTMDATPPTVSSIQSPSSPRNTAVSTIDFTFSEPIDAGTLDTNDLTLTRNGGSNLLTPAQTVTFVSGNTYRIGNLSPVTGTDGGYVLTIDATGVQDLAGNAGTGSASTSWTMQSSGFQISSLAPVTPNPRTTAVSTIDVTFSAPIDVSTFTNADLSLTRDAGPNLLADPLSLGAVTVTLVAGTTYRIGGLTNYTGVNGGYQLTVDVSGIQDAGGHAGSGTASTSWTLNTVVPKIAYFTPISPNPRETSVDHIDVTFSEALAAGSFTTDDVTLKQGSVVVPLTGTATVSSLGGTTWRIGNLASLTNIDASYALTVNAAGVQDAGAHAGSGAVSTKWTLKRVPPTVVSISAVSPNPTNVAVDGFDVTFSEPIDPATFSFADLGLTLNKVDASLTSAVKTTFVSGNTWHIGGLAGFTGTDGKYTFTVNTAGLTDANGVPGAKASSVSWTADFIAPTVKSTGKITPNPRNAPLDSITVTFSEKIAPASFDFHDLTLTRDGHLIALSSSQVITGSGTTFQIGGLSTLTGADGGYVLTINAAGVLDLAGNAGVGSNAATWTMDTVAPASTIQSSASPTATGTSLALSITGNDPAAPNGALPTGIKSYDLYVSIDGGAFSLWTTVAASKTAAITKATYAAQIDHTYSFRSVARDAAGNVESKPANAIDVIIAVPDLAPPVTDVSSVDTSTSTFVVSIEGFDVGSNKIVATFDLYVSLDGGAAKRFVTVAGGTPDAGGVYHVQTQYAAKTDGLAHTYRFYSRGTDGRGNVEAAPTAPADVVVNGTFAAPHLAASASDSPSNNSLDTFFSDPGNVSGLIADLDDTPT